MKKKIQQNISWKEILYFTCLFVYILSFTLIREGGILAYVHVVKWDQYVTCVHIINGLLVIKIIFDIVQNPRIIGIVALTEAIGFMVYSHNTSDAIVAVLWFLCASKDINPEKVTKCLFWSHLFSFLFMQVLCITDIIPFGKTVKAGHTAVSYALGFSHPNIAGAKILQIVLLFWLLKKGKLALRHYVGLIVVMAGVKVITDCSTVVMLLGFLLVVTILYNLPGTREFLNRKLNVVRNVFLACYLGIMGAAIAFFSFYKNDAAFKGLGTIGSRISQAIKYYKYYGFSMWGQRLIYFKLDPEEAQKAGLYTLDNGHMYLLLGFGVVLFLCIILLHVGTIWQIFKKRQLYYVVPYVMFFIYGFFETNVLRTTMNFTLFYLFGFIWEYYEKNVPSKKDQCKKGD